MKHLSFFASPILIVRRPLSQATKPTRSALTFISQPDTVIPYNVPQPIRHEFCSSAQLSLKDLKAIPIHTEFHHNPGSLTDKFALSLVKLLRKPSDIFFKSRYIHRALLLETVAAIPGQIASLLKHLKHLRMMESKDDPVIAHMMHEAENERMHLCCWREIASPTFMDRVIVSSVQVIFFNAYFLLYFLAPKVAHRMVGYLEEEAIVSYTLFANAVESGKIENVKAPRMAIEYWNLKDDARLLEVVYAVRADEAKHRDVNHFLASN